MFVGTLETMILTCARCHNPGEPPPAHRIPFPKKTRDRVGAAICASCWKEWEGHEIKVINEYRLNLLEPEHRDLLARACLEFLGLPLEA